MNSEVFKKFIAPYFDDAVRRIKMVVDLSENVDKHIPFVAGFMCGSILITSGEINLYTNWRDCEVLLQEFTHEEVRRIFDYVRLRLETESTTS